MTTKKNTPLIGGELCRQPLAQGLLQSEPRELTHAEVDSLWRLFKAIGQAWDNVYNDSAGLKSSWLEFISEKCMVRPSYVAEYVNAINVDDELIAKYDEMEAFHKLFFDNGLPENSLDTRLAHAKHFVVDEFIRAQVTAGGFKKFIEPDGEQPEGDRIRPDNIVNYRGFVAGSRFNRIVPVRPYKGPSR